MCFWLNEEASGSVHQPSVAVWPWICSSEPYGGTLKPDQTEHV